MSRRPLSEARRAGWMILCLLAIPFVTVSSVALLADVASSTDPAAALIGLAAMFVGVVAGASVLRLARAARAGAIAARAWVATLVGEADRQVLAAVGALTGGTDARPAHVLVPARVGRRGPPPDRR